MGTHVPRRTGSRIRRLPAAYLAYGLCEPHGPQNTLGNDGIRSHETLILVAREHGGIVCPPYYWHCHEIAGYGNWGERVIGNKRTWLTGIPPWHFLKSICYHIRAMDAHRFKATVLFSGHSGPHRLDVPIVIGIMQQHVDTQLSLFMSSGTDADHFGDDLGTGGHAGRGETSQLWAVAPDCVDLSRIPEPDEPGPHFAMGGHAALANRQAGERMTEDVIDRIASKAREGVGAYEKKQTSILTYGDVEAIWSEEIQPKLQDFASLQEPDEPPAEGSQWRANWSVPDLGGL